MDAMTVMGSDTQPGELIFTSAQEEFIDACSHRGAVVLALGGPGSGKTTALIEAVARRVEAGIPLDRLVVLTWSRPAAQRLRARIIDRLGRSQLAPVMTTVPGWCLALQRRFGLFDGPGELPRLLTGPEQQMQVRELIKQLGPGFWPEQVRAALPTMAFSQDLRAGIAKARQLGFSPDDVVRLGGEQGRAEWVSMGHFFAHYLNELDAQRMWDYTELVHRTRLLLSQDSVHNILTAECGGVFCDEFGELDKAQIGLLQQIHQAGITLGATGDPHTAVFAFRGADPRACADFIDRFGVVGADKPRIVRFRDFLRGNFTRSDKNSDSKMQVASLVNRLAAHDPQSIMVSGKTESDRPIFDEDIAPIRCVTSSTEAAQILAIAAELRQGRKQGVEWSQQAVICRAGRGRISTISRGLADAGIPVALTGNDVVLSEQFAVMTLINAVEIALNIIQQREIAEFDRVSIFSPIAKLLNSPLIDCEPSALRAADKIAQTMENSVDISGAYGALTQWLARSLYEKSDNDIPVAGNRLKRDKKLAITWQKLEAFVDVLKRTAADIQKGCTSYDVLWRVWKATEWPQRLKGTALSGGRDADAAHRDLDSIIALFDLASRQVELSGSKAIEALLEEVFGQEIPGDQSRESDLSRSGVQVMTAHRCKGMQWQRVILADTVEGEWPGRRGSEGLLSARLLDPENIGLPVRPGPEWVRLERRLFILAASRATDEVIATCVVGTGSDRREPSRFVREMGAEVQEFFPAPVQMDTLTELVGTLRRVSCASGESLAVQAAAAGQVGALAVLKDSQGRLIARGADPQEWWGLAGFSDNPSSDTYTDACEGAHGRESTEKPVVRISVTGLQRFMDCPRQWFLDNRARGAMPAGSAANQGTFIHSLAERSVTELLGSEQLHEALDDAWPELGADFGWRSETALQAAHDMVERFDRWARKNPREIIGVEVPICHRFDLESVVVELVGTIDRLERDTESGRIWIVDLKTGKHAVTNNQAASNLQLASYQLAISVGALADVVGKSPELGGAELIYVGVPSGAKDPLLPKVMAQKSLDDHPYPTEEQGRGSWLARLAALQGPLLTMSAGPTMVHDALLYVASCAVKQTFPAVTQESCKFCAHRAGCPALAEEGM